MVRTKPTLKLVRKLATEEDEEREVVIARRGVASMNLVTREEENSMNVI